MPVNHIRLVLPAAALIALFGAAACGSVATPEWSVEAQGTRVALAATSDYLTANAPTFTPTFTPIPPTATRTPLPTATLIPTNTLSPTPGPTTAATIAPTDALPAQNVTGDAVRGQEIFTTPHLMPDGATWMCATCHSITSDQQRLIGPGLWDVSVRALTYPGVTDPAQYIHNSIVNSAAFLAPVRDGEPPWPLQMPTSWAQVLTEQDINDLVAYVMTLHE
jgi:mono/diheme cytochrome c family protein